MATATGALHTPLCDLLGIRYPIGQAGMAIQEDIIEGLENAPRALVGVLHGDNTGKRMVRVVPEPV